MSDFQHRSLGAALVALAALAGCGQPADRAEEPSADAVSVGAPATPEASPAAGPPVTSETKTFRDWFAVCDNGNDCMAFGPAAEDGTGWVRVHMPPGPSARPDVRAGFWPQEGDIGAAAIRVAVDGRNLPTIPYQKDDEEVVLADPEAAVAVLVAGRAMTLTMQAERQAMNLNGVSAALLWIDERQGRLNTVTALVRKGDQPASVVPQPPALPLVVAAPAMSQTGFGDVGQKLPASIEATAEARECRAETAHSPAIQKEVQSARLGDATELWGVPCFAGAYNFGTRYFLTGPGGSKPRALSLDSVADVEDTLINAGYSAETRTLTQFAKGRGIGDCGVASTWTWTGRDFVLTEESAMTRCWGVGADRWPSTWRSRNR